MQPTIILTIFRNRGEPQRIAGLTGERWGQRNGFLWYETENAVHYIPIQTVHEVIAEQAD